MTRYGNGVLRNGFGFHFRDVIQHTRYLKFLTKKFLKKKTLRDWLRMLTAGRQAYKLRYFNIHNQDDEADEE